MYSIANAAGLMALLFPSALSALPSEYSSPDVPWKRDGLKDVSYRSPSNGDGKNSRYSWSGGCTVDTDMDQSWPGTGKTVTYNFEITNMTMAPDGFARPMMVVNGQYPGPTVEADWGDTIEVTVKNSLSINGTGIHWHGLRQFGTNQMDGTNGLTECPLAPGQTKTYKFKATQYGTSWYHSHYSVQYGDGIVGTILIRGPATADYDIDLGVLPFTDWFHTPLFTVNAQSFHAHGPPTADNVLVNGSMISSAGGKYAVTNLTPGKTHLLRLVNTGINNFIHVSLDGHPFTVIAADFVPIVPYTTNSLAIAIGQRYDVLINANQGIGNYWLRVGTGGGRCDGPNANAANIRSIFRYHGASSGNPNSTGITLPTGCTEETNIVPHVKTQVPQEMPEKLTLSFSQTAASGNLVQWLINDSAMLINFEQPTLFSLLEGNDTFNKQQNVYEVGEKNQWQYWVIQQDNTTAPLPHPIHLHGHDFYVLDSAENAQWSGDISRLKTDNPIRRDTAVLPAFGYLVLAFESDNPGAWLMHCHIPFHISQGFGVQFLERKDEILGTLGDLSELKQSCKAWGVFQDEFYADGFEKGDSGL